MQTLKFTTIRSSYHFTLLAKMGLPYISFIFQVPKSILNSFALSLKIAVFGRKSPHFCTYFAAAE